MKIEDRKILIQSLFKEITQLILDYEKVLINRTELISSMRDEIDSLNRQLILRR